MTETYEQAFARLVEECHKARGDIPGLLMPSIEEDAKRVLVLQELPVLQPIDEKNHYRCTQCKRYVSKNYYLRDAEGYASLNCVEHAWVGRWK